MSVVSFAFTLFLVFNSLGSIPALVAMLKPYSPHRQRIIIIREMLIALGILLMFGFFGQTVLDFLGITPAVIGLAGGILLLIIALTMIFPKPSDANTTMRPVQHEPFVVPIAIPLLAGPGSITSIMLFATYEPVMWKILFTVFLAWLPSFIIVLSCSYVKYLVGEKGLVAFERLGGLLIALLAVQMMASGSVKLVRENFLVPEKPSKSRIESPAQNPEKGI
ncbi:MAG: hypothetical protein A3F09_02330 [Chlamydiae bacterium RIFCSPHIGHO2_12_FULL_49_11]|nr:MAG: hypothetical protein A3F09_02330 [Chlamydiae bacterium RIFCSPHIGHO2_12_FULL_49_11]